MQHIATFFSYLFHPLFTTYYACVLALFYHPTIRGRIADGFTIQIAILLLIIVVIIPLLSILMVKRSGYIDSFHMKDSKERIIPFAIVAAMMFLSAYKINTDGILVFCGRLIIAAGIGLLINIPFLLKGFKPSAHCMALAGGASAYLKEGYLWLNNEMIFIGALSLLLLGVLGTLRIYNKAHTLKEIWVGSIIGFLVILPLI